MTLVIFYPKMKKEEKQNIYSLRDWNVKLKFDSMGKPKLGAVALILPSGFVSFLSYSCNTTFEISSSASFHSYYYLLPSAQQKLK